MAKEEKTEITASGLRYKSKKNGSPFEGIRMGDTMSCLKCGKHKPRGLGTFKRILGMSSFVCGECSSEKSISDEKKPAEAGLG